MSLHAVHSMESSDVPIPVFIETNLGTRLAVPVSPNITAEEFKRELEMKHLNCFPEIGSITVNALMVKQKSCCYHLSESLPLKYAFWGSKRTWFLQVDVHLFKCNDKKVHNLNLAADFVTVKKKTKHRRKEVKLPSLKSAVLKNPEVVCFLKRKKQKNATKKHETACSGKGPKQQPLDKDYISETFSEAVSVSGIIKKYFSDYDEVASGSCFPYYTKGRINSGNKCKFINIQKCTKPEVGKRLLLASDSLGLTLSNQKPAISLCRGSDGNSPARKLEGVVRNLVFEITEEGG